jgi:hypothetical protein
VGGRPDTPPCRAGRPDRCAEQGGREAGDAAVPSRAGRPDRRAEQRGREAGGAAVPSRAGRPDRRRARTTGWAGSRGRQPGTGGRRQTGGVGRVVDVGGRQAAAGAGKAPRRPSGRRRRPAGARREAPEHEQDAGRHDVRLAAGSNSSVAPVGAGVQRWAEKTTLNSFSLNLRVGHDLPGPPCRSAPVSGRGKHGCTKHVLCPRHLWFRS